MGRSPLGYALRITWSARAIGGLNRVDLPLRTGARDRLGAVDQFMGQKVHDPLRCALDAAFSDEAAAQT